MRIARVAAVPVACLLARAGLAAMALPGTTLLPVPVPVPVPAAAIADDADADADAETAAAVAAGAADAAFRIMARATPATPRGWRAALDGSQHLRFENRRLEYFPFADSRLRVELGFDKDRRAGAPRRHASPGLVVAYDRPLDADNRFNVDLGMRYARNAMATQLVRYAQTGEQRLLGARAARFGPAAHLTFVHAF